MNDAKSVYFEFWQDGEFFVGRLLEVPGVFSQGETFEELRENIQDAYDLMVTQRRSPAPDSAQQQLLELDVCSGKPSYGNWNRQGANLLAMASDTMCTAIQPTGSKLPSRVTGKSPILSAR
jgi:predicted RNase H-like HicB family nuclease